MCILCSKLVGSVCIYLGVATVDNSKGLPGGRGEGLRAVRDSNW